MKAIELRWQRVVVLQREFFANKLIIRCLTGPALHHNDLHQLDDDDKYAHLSTSKPTEYPSGVNQCQDFLSNRPE